MPTAHQLAQRPSVVASPAGHHSYGAHLSADAFLSLGCMEGMYESIVSPGRIAIPADHPYMKLAPGVLAALGLALLAYLIHLLPFAPFGVFGTDGLSLRHPVSAAIIAIILGLLARNVLALPDSIKSGCKTIVKRMIPVAIVCMGANLNLRDLAGVGPAALAITVISLVLAIAAGYYVGRWFGLNPKAAMLLGAGTGICGNSAIVAVGPLIDAEDDDLAVSVGTVNLMAMIAMLVWPMLGSWLAMSSGDFAIWSGVSIHAVPQVVAAALAYSPDAGTLATLVKLVRVTLLAPMIFVLALLHARQAARNHSSGQSITVRYTRLIPWFVWGFVALAVINTFGLIPTLTFEPSATLFNVSSIAPFSIQTALVGAGSFLLTLAMAAIGLEVNIRQLLNVGVRAIAAGLVATAVLGGVSLLLILTLT